MDPGAIENLHQHRDPLVKWGRGLHVATVQAEFGDARGHTRAGRVLRCDLGGSCEQKSYLSALLLHASSVIVSGYQQRGIFGPMPCAAPVHCNWTPRKPSLHLFAFLTFAHRLFADCTIAARPPVAQYALL